MPTYPKLHNKPLHGPEVVVRVVLYTVYQTIHSRMIRTRKCKEDHERWLLATKDWHVLHQMTGLKELAESPKTRHMLPIKIQTLSGDVYELYGDRSSDLSLTSSLADLKRVIEKRIYKPLADFDLLWHGQVVTSASFLTNRSMFCGSTLQIVYRND